VLFLLFAAIPYTFQRAPYHFTVSQAGLTFISIGIGVIFGVATCILVDRTFYQKHHRQAVAEGRTHVVPEHRLYSAMIGSSGIVVGLFWFGWSAGTGQHWAVCLAGLIPFAWGNICLFVGIHSLYSKTSSLTSWPNVDFRSAISSGYVWPAIRRLGHGSKWGVAIHFQRSLSTVCGAE
jgi:hypothetical protein